MAKYMFQVSYTREGVQGLLKEGGTSRATMVEKLVSNMGGSLDSFHFSFGEHDAFVICDVPSNVDVAAIAMTVGAAGGATTKTTVLLTPEEVDQATERSVEYRAPGK